MTICLLINWLSFNSVLQGTLTTKVSLVFNNAQVHFVKPRTVWWPGSRSTLHATAG